MSTSKLTAYLPCDKFIDSIYEVIEQRYKASRYKDAIAITLDEQECIVSNSN